MIRVCCCLLLDYSGWCALANLGMKIEDMNQLSFDLYSWGGEFVNVYCVLILITGMIQKKKKDPLHWFFSCNINIKMMHTFLVHVYFSFIWLCYIWRFLNRIIVFQDSKVLYCKPACRKFDKNSISNVNVGKCHRFLWEIV